MLRNPTSGTLLTGIIACLLLGSPAVPAQSVMNLAAQSSPGFAGRQLSLGYSRENNIYFWRGTTLLQHSVGEGTLFLNNTFDISRITATGTDDKWKDTDRLNAQYVYPLSDLIRPVFSADFNYLSDRQSGFLNNITEQSVNVQLPIGYGDMLTVTPVVGYKWDKRLDNPDNGLRHGVDLSVYRLRLGDYYSEVQGGYVNEQLDDRTNRLRNLSLMIGRSFYGEASDTMRVSFNDQRRDYYISETGDMESRKEENRRIENTLNYNLSERSTLSVQSVFSVGAVDISSEREQEQYSVRSIENRETDLDVRLRFRSEAHFAALYLSYLKSDQDYDGVISDLIYGALPFDYQDNRGERIKLGGDLSGILFREHRYTVETFVENFRFDTPSETNYDDHDEIRYGVKTEYVVPLNSRLSFSVHGLASLNHLVYIYKERSADNNWNRVFEAGTGVQFRRRSGLSFEGKYRVLANYIDYDYDHLFTEVRSFIFRKYALEHRLNIPVSPRGELFAQLQVNLEENGLLVWEDFVQNKLIDRTVVSGTVKYRYRCSDRLNIEPGYLLFHRTEERGTGGSSLAAGSRLSSIKDNGVQLLVAYRVRPDAQLRFVATRRFSERGPVKQDFSYMDISINWLF